MERQFATICGVTQNELESYFAPAIAQLNTFEQLDKPALMAKIKDWYNGYRFEASDPQEMSVQSVFVQTGYLTIKAYNNSLYTLDFPNYEVKQSFYNSVATRYGHLDEGEEQTYTSRLIQCLTEDNLEAFFDTLREFFANIPYDLHINMEKYYHSLFYAVFTLIGLNIEAEVKTNKGRIDCVLQTIDTIYIIEFKLRAALEIN